MKLVRVAVSVLVGAVTVLVAPTAAPAASTCPSPVTTVMRASPRPTVSRTVALTFDDGPSRYTPQVLAVLRRYGVHATFFETGAHVRAWPEISRRVVATGNRIGNHTYTHPQAVRGSSPYGSYDTLPLSVQADQLDRTTRVIQQVTGTTPCVFRGPGGHHFAHATVSMAGRRGMSTTHWTLTSGDSGQMGRADRRTVGWIAANAVRRPGPHPIVLMHDGKASAEPESQVSSYRGNTVTALPRIIGWYRAHGYTFTDVYGQRF